MPDLYRNKPVRIGLAGITRHGRTILDAIRNTDTLQLVSCFDVDRAACKDACVRFGVTVHESFESFVSDPAIDAVALATPNHLHAPQALLAIANGKHVFVEKPIANSERDALRMIEAAQEAGLVLMVGHNTRRRKPFRKAKPLLDDGTIGIPIAAEANLSRRAGLDADMPAWKKDPACCMLLPMSQLGIHFVDATHYFFGPIRSVSAFARRGAMPCDAYDTAGALLTTASGVLVTLLSSYCTMETFTFQIFGTEGYITCTDDTIFLFTVDQENPVIGEFREEGDTSFTEEMDEFAECILFGRKPETDGRSALHALRVVLAMQRSIETGTCIPIEDDLS
ncbi:MAG: Gfo/Idh/MocA family oxidoreductase [Bacteroidota bacterium]|nr:Gfo/Idh/MocA family oxidoreductase [Bacteroidota bacterium]